MRSIFGVLVTISLLVFLGFFLWYVERSNNSFSKTKQEVNEKLDASPPVKEVPKNPRNTWEPRRNTETYKATSELPPTEHNDDLITDLVLNLTAPLEDEELHTLLKRYKDLTETQAFNFWLNRQKHDRQKILEFENHRGLSDEQLFKIRRTLGQRRGEFKNLIEQFKNNEISIEEFDQEYKYLHETLEPIIHQVLSSED